MSDSEVEIMLDNAPAVHSDDTVVVLDGAVVQQQQPPAGPAEFPNRAWEIEIDRRNAIRTVCCIVVWLCTLCVPASVVLQ